MFLGADRHGGHCSQLFLRSFQKIVRNFLQVGFIKYENKRDFLFDATGGEILFRLADSENGIHNQKYEIRFAQNLQ